MSRHILLMVFLGLSLLQSTTFAADKLRIATEGAYPPFNMKNTKGELTGFDVDIARALCEAMKAECDIVAQDWDGIIPGLLARKYDAIIASMSVTEERKRVVDFTDKYYANSLAFVAPKGSHITIDEAGLRGKKMGAQRATVSASYLEDNFAKWVTPKLYDTQKAAWLDLSSDRIDLVLVDRLPGYEWLHSDAGKKFDFVGEKILLDDEIGIAIRKGDTELQAKFNSAIKTLRENGQYQTINAKYFPFDIY